jgi:hypothetical protein
VDKIEITKVLTLLFKTLDIFVQNITPSSNPKKYKSKNIPTKCLALITFSTKNNIKTAGIEEDMEFNKNIIKYFCKIGFCKIFLKPPLLTLV